jgi:hypothetical protein
MSAMSAMLSRIATSSVVRRSSSAGSLMLNEPPAPAVPTGGVLGDFSLVLLLARLPCRHHTRHPAERQSAPHSTANKR